MAEDIWTLHLECEWASPGQKHVTREMDRDEICFFNLMEFVEEYGYTSIDYLYYKRGDGLVPIEWDTDVMEMLEEHETEKEVSLFMTKRPLATMVPSKSNKATAKSAPEKSKGQKGTKKKKKKKKKGHVNIIQTDAHYANDIGQQQDDDIQETPELRTRKGTVLTHVWNLQEGKRIVVNCNQLGQPIGKEGGLLGQFLGTIARNGGYCPVDVKDWRKVKKDGAETMLQLIQTKFLYPRSCEKWILKSIGRDWRKYKSTLKKKLFNPKKKRSTLYKLCPDDVDQDQWNNIVKYWKSIEGKARSEINKTAREMRKSTHSAGSKSYARWSEDMRQADPAKKQPHRAEVYLATHRIQGTNDDVVQLENLIVKQPELAQSSDGRVAWEGDALHQVLGEEKHGSVHGMGLLPFPKQVYGRTTRHFKDINITTVEGSSSNLDAHMLEEIRQLKEHARKQDKIIDELKNNQTHEENEEPSMANLVSTDHGKFQNHVNSKRKRVQCAMPNHGDTFCKGRDELNKHACVPEYSDDDSDDLFLANEKSLDDPCQDDPNYKELPHEAVEPTSSECSINQSGQKEFQVHKRNSSDGRIIKKMKTIMSQQGVRQETTTIAQQNVTRGNAASHKGSKYMQPSIKVGSTVLLKTSNYRNKAIVAYATLLSSSPKENVGGVEIGKQFYKVRINHPTVQDEPLVRPIAGCKTIGDVHAKGVPIAWPSICVEMING